VFREESVGCVLPQSRPCRAPVPMRPRVARSAAPTRVAAARVVLRTAWTPLSVLVPGPAR